MILYRGTMIHLAVLYNTNVWLYHTSIYSNLSLSSLLRFVLLTNSPGVKGLILVPFEGNLLSVEPDLVKRAVRGL